MTKHEHEHPTEVQLQGRRIFDATIERARLMIARGLDPGAVVAGLLAVATTIASETVGARETRRMLMLAADSCADDEGATLQ